MARTEGGVMGTIYAFRHDLVGPPRRLVGTADVIRIDERPVIAHMHSLRQQVRALDARAEWLDKCRSRGDGPEAA